MYHDLYYQLSCSLLCCIEKLLLCLEQLCIAVILLGFGNVCTLMFTFYEIVKWFQLVYKMKMRTHCTPGRPCRLSIFEKDNIGIFNINMYVPTLNTLYAAPCAACSDMLREMQQMSHKKLRARTFGASDIGKYPIY